MSAEDQAHIIGVMGTLWGEAIRDINRATYMAYPRAFALAEAGPFFLLFEQDTVVSTIYRHT